MSSYYIFYHSLVVLSLLLSFVAVFLGHKRYYPLLLTLLLTEAVEIIAQIATIKQIPFVWVYHVFVMIEYSLFCLYIKMALSKKAIKQVLSLSIPIFVVVSFSISYFFYHFRGFPGLNINIEGLLLFIFCTTLLFNLEVNEKETF